MEIMLTKGSGVEIDIVKVAYEEKQGIMFMMEYSFSTKCSTFEL